MNLLRDYFKKSFLIILTFLSQFAVAQDSNKVLIKVGDPAPVFKAYKWTKGKAITNFEKGKIYVVEFGATWCVPCAAMIPHLTDISKKYKDKVEVVGVFVMEQNTEPPGTKKPKYVKGVEQYVAKQGERMLYNIAIDDPAKSMENNWLKSAGKSAIPCTFILDKNGSIAYIGSNAKEVEKAVELLVNDSYDIIKVAKAYQEKLEGQTTYDPFKLLLIDGNGGNSHDFLFRSLLTNYKGDILVGRQPYIPGSYAPDYKGGFQVIGQSLGGLYYTAYSDTLYNAVPYGRHIFTGKYFDRLWDTVTNSRARHSYGHWWYEPILEVNDNSPFKYFYKFPNSRYTENRYNYSVSVPAEIGTARFTQEVMQRDLKNYFGYDVIVETRKMPYWKLSATESISGLLKPKNPGKEFEYKTLFPGVFSYRNGIMRDIIYLLGSFYGYLGSDHGKLSKEEQAPFIDETGITDEIDFVFYSGLSFAEQVEYLNSLGLKLTKSYKDMKVVVIRDPK